MEYLVDDDDGGSVAIGVAIVQWRFCRQLLSRWTSVGGVCLALEIGVKFDLSSMWIERMTTAGHQCGGKALLVRDDGRQRACSCSLPSGGPPVRKRQCQFVHRPLCSGSVSGRLNLQKFDKHYLFIDLFSYHLHHQGSGFCTFPGARFYLHFPQPYLLILSLLAWWL
ncbi:hypothetical protein D917_04425 [Trichinella nativa]|uniref:Uncharacterized protein n=1 Tax=Trichinella nativa TaxID=6335 RepID=A0A1Y3E4D5_9BILA|nr:hypothetical protein D917_04425 [Trichinella nativa]